MGRTVSSKREFPKWSNNAATLVVNKKNPFPFFLYWCITLARFPKLGFIQRLIKECFVYRKALQILNRRLFDRE